MAVGHWLQLSLTDGVGPVLARRLIDAAGGVDAACAADAAMLQTIEGIGPAKARSISQSLRSAVALAEEEFARADAVGVRIICADDGEYPVLLKSIPDPPMVLYVRGTLEPRDLHAVALVGSRKCSHYGREQAERFAALLAGAGVTVMSGGARGVDSSAHRGALSHPHGRTVAVLGSGADVAYPPENAALFEQIAGRGAVVSEYPMGTPPLKDNFPRRNRIISGVSRAVLVIEADERSGALITARQAGEDQGRPVLALPGKVDNPLSAGPHKLIRDGAVLVTKLEDILEELGPMPAEAVEQDATAMGGEQAAAPPKPQPSEGVKSKGPSLHHLSEQQLKIVAAIGTEPASVDTIVERTGLLANVVLGELTLLSLKGSLRRVDGNTYARRPGVGD